MRSEDIYGEGMGCSIGNDHLVKGVLLLMTWVLFDRPLWHQSTGRRGLHHRPALWCPVQDFDVIPLGDRDLS